MKLERIYSHPPSRKYPNGKSLIVHIGNVKKKALGKYFGPNKYKKYLDLVAVFHDIGKANANFQEYLFAKNKTDFDGKYKNHGYLSSLTLLTLIVYNKEYFSQNYKQELLGLLLVLISKHHANLPDICGEREVLSQKEIDSAFRFFTNDRKVAEEYANSVNDYLRYFGFKLRELKLSDLVESIFSRTNKVIKGLVGKIETEQRLEYFLLAQYIFSCVIEADKRDASDNDTFQLTDELMVFNSKYFSNRLYKYYNSFKKRNVSKKQASLNNVRTEIKDGCLKNIRKYIRRGERVFQIIAPTGSGKTLAFLSAASEIKKLVPKKGLKIVYSLPFLTITDQVTKECEKIFTDNKVFIYRIDSAGKTVNEDTEIIKESYSDQQDSSIDLNNQLILRDFAEHTFDHAFIITTFVKLFETLTANRNRDLLRFNNFSRSIIIVDEIQSLPPRTYTFLIALLSKYAQLFDSYVIIGSATVPMFVFPESERALIKEVNEKQADIRKIFYDYKPPINLLSDYVDKYKNEVFNRYKIKIDLHEQTLQELANKLLKENISTLCVLNTKRSSLELFEMLNKSKKNVFLLNTMQTLTDRRKKLDIVIRKLKNKETVYLVSTQLIEAGIDVSFPRVYRDLAPFPSIIQSAGRCNRNREIKEGDTIITNLVNEKGKAYSSMVYKDLMDLTRRILEKIPGSIHENELLSYQKIFFDDVSNKLEFGKYFLKYTDLIDKDYFLQLAVKYFEFNKISQFSLIESEEFDSFSVFIIQTDQDLKEFEDLHDIKDNPFDFSLRIKIQKKISSLSTRIVSIPTRLHENTGLFVQLKERELFGLSYIDVREDVGVEYSFEKGLIINNQDDSLLIP